MKRVLILTALTLVTGSATLANTITQPHCNAGSTCRAALEQTAAIPAARPDVTPQNGAAGIGTNWGWGPVSPGPDSVAMCTATVGCDPVIPTPVLVENDCALSQVESLVGHPIEIAEEYHLTVRVFSAENMVGTTDYWPWRFNVFIDEDGMITQAFCG